MSMSDETVAKGRSTFRGHPIIWDGARWLYEDNRQPIPGYGGENRPCKKCGSGKWSGDGEHDQCLGLLPGVTNACCGHGDTNQAYIIFETGLVIRGFSIADY